MEGGGDFSLWRVVVHFSVGAEAEAAGEDEAAEGVGVEVAPGGRRKKEEFANCKDINVRERKYKGTKMMKVFIPLLLLSVLRGRRRRGWFWQHPKHARSVCTLQGVEVDGRGPVQGGSAAAAFGAAAALMPAAAAAARGGVRVELQPRPRLQPGHQQVPGEGVSRHGRRIDALPLAVPPGGPLHDVVAAGGLVIGRLSTVVK